MNGGASARRLGDLLQLVADLLLQSLRDPVVSAIANRRRVVFDRRQGDAAPEGRDVPTGRSGGDAELVRGDPRPHRPARVATAGRLWMPGIGASVSQNAGCLEKSTRTRERQSSTKGLAGRYFGRSEPRNRGCGGENVKKTPRDRRGGGAACYNRDTASLDRFQAQPKWEISVQSAAVQSCTCFEE